jgi:hypothetical protein
MQDFPMIQLILKKYAIQKELKLSEEEMDFLAGSAKISDIKMKEMPAEE